MITKRAAVQYENDRSMAKMTVKFMTKMTGVSDENDRKNGIPKLISFEIITTNLKVWNGWFLFFESEMFTLFLF